MKLRVNVDENSQEKFEELLKEQEITPEMIAEAPGYDGVSIWKYILEYGPDTLKLLTAIVAFWNEVQKTRQKGEKRKIEIILETDNDETKNDEPKDY